MSPGAGGPVEDSARQSPVRGTIACMAVGAKGSPVGSKGLESCGWTHPVCPGEVGLAAHGPTHLWREEHQGQPGALSLQSQLGWTSVRWPVTLCLPLDRTRTAIHHGEAELQLLGEDRLRGRGYHGQRPSHQPPGRQPATACILRPGEGPGPAWRSVSSCPGNTWALARWL